MRHARFKLARRPVLALALTTLTVLLVFVLAACSGGSGGGATSGPDTEAVSATGAPAGTTTPRFAEEPPSDWSGDIVHLEELPPETLETLVLIASDGPYPYDQDGSTFQNREGILPERLSDFYEEFTVETPGSPDRGARRLVVGDDDAAYYTDDHYDSFSFVAP